MQTAIVTGGNSGLGYQCARAIAAASSQWHVIIASRDHAKSNEAARSLAAETENQHVVAMDLDLGSLASVRRFAADFASDAMPPLKAIVCNAGVQIISGLTFNTDGFETTFAVNHLGHFLLVNLLLGQLVPPARIIVVSSGTHNPDQFTGMPKPIYSSGLKVPAAAGSIGAARPLKRTAGLQRLAGAKWIRTCSPVCSYASWPLSATSNSP